MRLHHVQVTCAPWREDLARRFYGAGLGLVEVDKPEPLTSLGGIWFRSFSALGAVEAEIHVGLEDPLTPARRAHPALLCATVTALDEVAERLGDLGFEVDRRHRDTYPGYERLHTHDAEGNRVELMAPAGPF